MTSPEPNSDPCILAETLKRLRHCSQHNIQANWHHYLGDISTDQIFANDDPLRWPIAPLNDRQHIFWPRGCQVLWLYQRITIPDTLTGYPLQGLTLRLSLAWWAEDSQIYVDGQFTQAGDLFDYFTRLCLTETVTPGQTFTLAIRLVSPGHDDGALVRSQLIYEVPAKSALPSPEPSFVADELEVLCTYAKALAPEKLADIEAATQHIDWPLLTPSTSSASLSRTDTTSPKLPNGVSPTSPTPPTPPTNQTSFHTSLATLRAHLLPFSDWIKQRQINCLGHAHLDLAWLWPVEDTWRAAERTFESVLALQDDFPELTYTHSSPALFAWLEEHRPELFKKIQQKVQTGSWSIDAGLWVEPELNIVSGESIARQILYGQRYCQEKFGHISPIAWLPDTFGFCNQLPQLLQLGEIEVFATQKLRWNDTTEFPHELFTWQAPDQSQVLGWTLPPIGTDFDPVAIATYASQWETKTGIATALWLPGIGDHGGGPTRDMLTKARRWSQSPFFPKVVFSSALEFLQHILPTSAPPTAPTAPSRTDKSDPKLPTGVSPTSPTSPSRTDTIDPKLPTGVSPTPLNLPAADTLARAGTRPAPTPPSRTDTSDPKLPTGVSPTSSPPSAPPTLPTWSDELYLELHRGCYTTHADQKQQNRHCEDLLYQAELWSTIAHLESDAPYPQPEIEQAWKKVLFNQFHDILPGSAIPEVFEDSNRDWAMAKQLGEKVLEEALVAIAKNIDRPTKPHPNAQLLILFNALNWERTETVTHLIPETSPGCLNLHWQVQSLDGHVIPHQTHFKVKAKKAYCQLSFEASAIPSVGYRLYWLIPDDSDQLPKERSLASTTLSTTDYILENQYLKVTVDPQTGELASLFDQQQQKQILSGPGNQLQAFRDQGQYWDAWNIAPDYESHALPATQLKSIQWEEQGTLRQCLRVIRTLGESEISQLYILETSSPALKIETWVNWQETQVVLKANFPLNLDAEQFTCETPFGSITRPTHPTTKAEQAKWEVPALRWADLSHDNSGLSILTQDKHGFDVGPHHLRLTLLKAPIWPDPNADKGIHHFTYAVYPHTGNWQQARTVHQALRLNSPLHSLTINTPDTPAPSRSHSPSNRTRLDSRSFLELTPDNLILAAFKRSENNASMVMLRCYDAYGITSHLQLRNTLNLSATSLTNLLEHPIGSPTTAIAPYQVATYSLQRTSTQK